MSAERMNKCPPIVTLASYLDNRPTHLQGRAHRPTIQPKSSAPTTVFTNHQAKYFALELTRQRGAEGLGRLTQSLFDAAVDLNPHQIDAALFALRSPLSGGTILADEVGLGKTIEAGVVLCQFWAERKRRLLVVCPASLRKQWQIELTEKFGLPARVLDAKTYNSVLATGADNPIGDGKTVAIVSYEFAARLDETLFRVEFDLIVLDEAHKLRNVWRPGNVLGTKLRRAFDRRRKLLLTATPLQNSLMELYGLATFLDPDLFGEPDVFRERFVATPSNREELRGRLLRFTQRTLRAQVREYIPYTERQAVTIPFAPSDAEQALYENVSAFLSRDSLAIIPRSQRHLTTLVLRKLLASSARAIAGTLEAFRTRLAGDPAAAGLPLLDELAEAEDLPAEYLEEELDAPPEEEAPADAPPDRAREIAEIDRFIVQANAIEAESKSTALLKAIDLGFERMTAMGAPRKALVFTESRRTQTYLKSFLEANGYGGRVVAFNGSNANPDSRAILDAWLAENRPLGRASGSRAIDMRMALVEAFRDKAEIMIATEAAAEGVNLQFCALVVNYDLPWNPQRVEQRIGRCHRYGQRFDVVVVNFLNERNAADRRVLELLDEKFALFRGVFGASDDVIGTIESGVDFEKRIQAIYETCRTEAEIESAFAALRAELDETIRARMAETRAELLAHLDEDVHARLKLFADGARDQLDRTGRMFWRLTKYALADRAHFDDARHAFELVRSPLPDVSEGVYRLIAHDRDDGGVAFPYRIGHPLGEWTLSHGLALPTPDGEIIFHLSDYPHKVSVLEGMMRRQGLLSLSRVTVPGFEAEELLVLAGIDHRNQALPPEALDKLFQCDAQWSGGLTPRPEIQLEIFEETEKRAIADAVAAANDRSRGQLDAERERLSQWAQDRIEQAEKALADAKSRIRALERTARAAATIEGALAAQRDIAEAEREKRKARARIFEVEDEVSERRDRLIAGLAARLGGKIDTERLFSLRFRVV